MTAVNDLDLINASLMGSEVRSVFGRDIEPGTSVTGEIIAVQRRHRRDKDTGELLYWVNKKPAVAEKGQPVYDSLLILQTEGQEDGDDDGQRAVYLDRDVQRAIRKVVVAAKADGLAIGGQITGLMFIGPDPKIKGGRIYQAQSYESPAA